MPQQNCPESRPWHFPSTTKTRTSPLLRKSVEPLSLDKVFVPARAPWHKREFLGENPQRRVARGTNCAGENLFYAAAPGCHWLCQCEGRDGIHTGKASGTQIQARYAAALASNSRPA
jgi:hypothetical protein